MHRTYVYSCYLLLPLLLLLITNTLSPNNTALGDPSSSSSSNTRRQSLRDRLQRNAKTPPFPDDGSPLSVKAGIYIESLGKFQSTEMVWLKFFRDDFIASSAKQPLEQFDEENENMVSGVSCLELLKGALKAEGDTVYEWGLSGVGPGHYRFVSSRHACSHSPPSSSS